MVLLPRRNIFGLGGEKKGGGGGELSGALISSEGSWDWNGLVCSIQKIFDVFVLLHSPALRIYIVKKECPVPPDHLNPGFSPSSARTPPSPSTLHAIARLAFFPLGAILERCPHVEFPVAGQLVEKDTVNISPSPVH